jgi:hypothetical protein
MCSKPDCAADCRACAAEKRAATQVRTAPPKQRRTARDDA